MTVTILEGDVLAMLREIPDETFGVVVTSPPYWGLRDYGVEGQLGLEPTLGEHLDRMIEVFDEVRRVLKQDGVCWVNYGDCYATAPNGRAAVDVQNDDRTFRDKPFSTVQGVMKSKDLCMVPNRFAIAMQEAGWWVRSEIIWAKPNPMPESVKDRPATAHEKIFMFTKAPRYHYDAEEVRFALQPKTLTTYTSGPRVEVADDGTGKVKKANFSGMVRKPRAPVPSGWDHGEGAHGTIHRDGRTDKQRGSKVASPRHKEYICHTQLDETPRGQGRNLRNYEPAPVQVWKIATRPFRQAHFATFPPELVERCLKSSLRPGDAVLDPFGGSGTTGLVADAFGADATLIEINPEYAALARSRLAAGLAKLDAAASPLPVSDGLFAWEERT